MSHAAAAVLADALRLGAHTRAERAAELPASLNGPTDAGTEWSAEIERRVASIESGTAILDPRDDVRRLTARDVLGR